MRYVPFVLTVAVACMFAATANASQLIDRNAHDVRLAVDAKGEAMITYTAGGKVKHVLAWDAVNAIAPTHARAQVAFRLDYAGGWGKSRTESWKTFGDRCGAYDGPPLAWKVAACKAPDGSYWALQSWQRMLPNYGGASERAAGVVGASALALDRRPAGADDLHRLGLAPVGPPLRDAHL